MGGGGGEYLVYLIQNVFASPGSPSPKCTTVFSTIPVCAPLKIPRSSAEQLIHLGYRHTRRDRGVGGSPNFFSHGNPNILGDIGGHAKFQNHSINPSGRKVCGTEEERRRKVITKIVDTSFCSHANGQRTQSARTKIITKEM